jgi:hypothetical protein
MNRAIAKKTKKKYLWVNHYACFRELLIDDEGATASVIFSAVGGNG